MQIFRYIRLRKALEAVCLFSSRTPLGVVPFRAVGLFPCDSTEPLQRRGRAGYLRKEIRKGAKSAGRSIAQAATPLIGVA